MICHYSPFTSNLLNTFTNIFLKYSTQKQSSHSTTLLSVSWSLHSFKSLTFTISSTVPGVGMSLFYYFLTYFLSGISFYSNLRIIAIYRLNILLNVSTFHSEDSDCLLAGLAFFAGL